MKPSSFVADASFRPWHLFSVSQDDEVEESGHLRQYHGRVKAETEVEVEVEMGFAAGSLMAALSCQSAVCIV